MGPFVGPNYHYFFFQDWIYIVIMHTVESNNNCGLFIKGDVNMKLATLINGNANVLYPVIKDVEIQPKTNEECYIIFTIFDYHYGLTTLETVYSMESQRFVKSNIDCCIVGRSIKTFVRSMMSGAENFKDMTINTSDDKRYMILDVRIDIPAGCRYTLGYNLDTQNIDRLISSHGEYSTNPSMYGRHHVAPMGYNEKGTTRYFGSQSYRAMLRWWSGIVQKGVTHPDIDDAFLSRFNRRKMEYVTYVYTNGPTIREIWSLINNNKANFFETMYIKPSIDNDKHLTVIIDDCVFDYNSINDQTVLKNHGYGKKSWNRDGSYYVLFSHVSLIDVMVRGYLSQFHSAEQAPTCPVRFMRIQPVDENTCDIKFRFNSEGNGVCEICFIYDFKIAKIIGIRTTESEYREFEKDHVCARIIMDIDSWEKKYDAELIVDKDISEVLSAIREIAIDPPWFECIVDNICHMIPEENRFTFAELMIDGMGFDNYKEYIDVRPSDIYSPSDLHFDILRSSGVIPSGVRRSMNKRLMDYRSDDPLEYVSWVRVAAEKLLLEDGRYFYIIIGVKLSDGNYWCVDLVYDTTTEQICGFGRIVGDCRFTKFCDWLYEKMQPRIQEITNNQEG